jgi:YVTN family beta-propeller protein
MRLRSVLLLTLLVCFATLFLAQLPGPSPDGYLLPNGWRLSPVGKMVHTEDLLLNIVPTPDGKNMVAIHSGFNPHGLVVIDGATDEAAQRLPLLVTWMGLAWNPEGTRLYVSGGNNRSPQGIRAPVYVFDYAGGKLSEKPVGELNETIAPAQIYWAGLIHHPTRKVLYAASRTAGQVVAFDTASGRILDRVKVEVNPYDLVLSPDGGTLYCSNWASDSISVIDTASLKVTKTIAVGDNPNDLLLTRDGRLFVACSNDNTVVVVDTKQGRAVETIVTSMYPRAPEGSTPNALAVSPDQKTLFVANADNNNVAVVGIEAPGKSTVLGFIPTGWYPSSLAVSPDGKKLYVGAAKGVETASNINGPGSPLPAGAAGRPSTKSTMKGTVHIVDIAQVKQDLRKLTKQAFANSPYRDELLAKAKAPARPSVIPRDVGAGSPIKHVLYIIKENRTYDQVLGDMGKGNGDPRLAIFGKEVTPNHHRIAEQFVLLDNLYCDAEVSADGHQWSNAAYATDFSEKNWPANYAGKSTTPSTAALMPNAGYLWDQAARKGLTYRSYGELARRVSVSEGKTTSLRPTSAGTRATPTTRPSSSRNSTSTKRTSTAPTPTSACRTTW